MKNYCYVSHRRGGLKVFAIVLALLTQHAAYAQPAGPTVSAGTGSAPATPNSTAPTAPAPAHPSTPSSGVDFSNMSIEELMKIEVIGAAGQMQKNSSVAIAIKGTPRDKNMPRKHLVQIQLNF